MKYLSTSATGFSPNLQFITASGNGTPSVKMTINGDGKTCIGSATTPSAILHVGNGGRLRISNGLNDFSILGTIDTDGHKNSSLWKYERCSICWCC
jgi:hypothetical protein